MHGNDGIKTQKKYHYSQHISMKQLKEYETLQVRLYYIYKSQNENTLCLQGFSSRKVVFTGILNCWFEDERKWNLGND
jgi:hypothetical protein